MLLMVKMAWWWWTWSRLVWMRNTNRIIEQWNHQNGADVCVKQTMSEWTPFVDDVTSVLFTEDVTVYIVYKCLVPCHVFALDCFI